MSWGECVRGRGERCFLLSLVYKQIWLTGPYARKVREAGRFHVSHDDPGKSLSSSSWCWEVGCPEHQVGLGSILNTESTCLCHGNHWKLWDYTSEHLIVTFHFLFYRFRNFRGFPGVNNPVFRMVILQAQEIMLNRKTKKSTTMQWEKKRFQKKISWTSSILVKELYLFPWPYHSTGV